MRMPPLAIVLLSVWGLLQPALVDAETLIVANKSDDTVDLIDLELGRSVATLPTGHAPHEVGVSQGGELAVISNYGDRETPGASLTVVDVRRAQVARTIDLSPHTRPHGVAFIDRSRVAVTTEGSRHLLVVDVMEGRLESAVETEQEVSHMVAVTPESRRAFVTNIGSGSVTAIALEEGRKLGDIPTGAGAEGIAVAPDGTEIWVTNRQADTVSIIDPDSLMVRAELPCPGFPIRIAFTPDGRSALISAARSGEVVVFDRELRSETRRAALDLDNAPDASRRLFGDRFGDSPVPVGLVVHPRGDIAWIAATQADIVVQVDPSTLAVVDLLEAGREPDGMGFSRQEVER